MGNLVPSLDSIYTIYFGWPCKYHPRRGQAAPGFSSEVSLCQISFLSWCRMDMKFALWGMKHFENSQRWIQRETNYWTTWVSPLNSCPLWPKGIMCMEKGQFLLSELCRFAVGVTWARDLCQLRDRLCDSWRGAASVPSLGLPWGNHCCWIHHCSAQRPDVPDRHPFSLS